jgi:hypothetical protein
LTDIPRSEELRHQDWEKMPFVHKIMHDLGFMIICCIHCGKSFWGTRRTVKHIKKEHPGQFSNKLWEARKWPEEGYSVKQLEEP